MNKMFVGKAMGVREKQEPILPKVLEDKTSIFDKEAHNRDKYLKGNNKMKDLTSKKFNEKFKGFDSKFASKTNSKKLNFTTKFSSDKVKTTSNFYLNGKHNIKNTANSNVAEKVNLFMKRSGTEKRKEVKQGLGKLNKFLMNNKKTLKGDKFSKNMTNDLTNLGNREVGQAAKLNTVPPTESERINRAKGIIPGVVEADYTIMPEEVVTTQKPVEAATEGPDSLERLGGFLKNKATNYYKGTEFAKNRERAKDLEEAKTAGKASVHNDPEFKERLANIYAMKEENRILYGEKDKQSGLQKFAATAGEAKQAIRAVVPPISTSRFKELSGFKVGSGFGFAAQSSLPKGDPASKIAMYTGNSFGQQQQMAPQAPREYQQMPKETPQTKDFNTIQKEYLRALINKRMESGRDIGESGVRKIERDVKKLSRLENQENDRVLDERTLQRVADDAGYKARKVHKDFGKKVMTEEGPKIVNAYGNLVSNLRKPYKKIDTSEVKLVEVQGA